MRYSLRTLRIATAFAPPLKELIWRWSPDLLVTTIAAILITASLLVLSPIR